jgi:PAS domain S-box-containing protein
LHAMEIIDSQKKPVIGIIITTLFDDYQRMIVTGIRRQAAFLKVRTVCFNAGLFDFGEFTRMSKFQVFSLISNAVIDGIVILPGALLWESGEKELADILRNCSGIPMVSIGIGLPGIPSIVVDNAVGMNRLFDHFIQVHGSKRIAFVRGPECNEEAQQRFKAYKDSLQRYGIPYDPDLVFQGDFETWAGPDAVIHFLDKKKVAFDTFICSDDQNAIQAIDALKKRGLRVPADVRVGGFDDIDMSRDCSPPLTTVHQPLLELGCMGMQFAFDLVDGKTVTVLSTVPTNLVTRSSCGCPTADLKTPESETLRADAPAGSSLLDAVYTELGGIFPFSWAVLQHEELFLQIESLISLIKAALDDPGLAGDVHAMLVKTVEAFNEKGMATTLWPDIIRKVLMNAASGAQTDAGKRNLQLLWKTCMTALSMTEMLVQSRSHMVGESEAINLQLIGHRLSACFTFEDIWKVLSTQLPLANIHGCCVSLFKEDQSQAHQYYSLSGTQCIPGIDVEFPKTLLVAGGLDCSGSTPYCIVPLIIEQGHEGFVVFEMDAVSRKFEMISEQIGNALRAAFLLEQIRKQNIVLRESENEDLRVTLNSIGDAVIATDAAGRVVRMNTVAEKMTGWPANEANAVSLFKVLGTSNMAEFQKIEQSFKKILLQGQVSESLTQISFTAKDGTERQVNYSGAPIRNLDSSIVGVVLVIRDVTEQLRLEEQLRQTQKMESLGQLASGIAHDLNNMMTGISGNAQMIQQMSQNPEYILQASKTILAITDSATELMHNLLAFAHKTKIQTAPVDIHACINDVKNILEHSIGKHIEIIENLKASNTIVCGESALLQNVLINLSLNARDAMTNGGTLTIATDNVMLDQKFCSKSSFDLVPGLYIAVRVRDTGQGMSPDVQKRIFEPFFTTKEIGKGTGLGLSAVYGIVKSHKGSITVHSKTGQGTTFAVYLPVDENKNHT